MTGGKVKKVQSDELTALLASLTTPEKRGALLQLGGAAKGAKLQKEEDVDEALATCGRSLEEIIVVLRSIEAATPKKHCYFATLDGDPKTLVDSARKKVARRKSSHVAHVSTNDYFALFSIERMVTARQRVPLAPRDGFEKVYGIQESEVRHVTIVQIEFASGRVVLTSPSLPIGDDYEYQLAIKAAVDDLASLGLLLKPLPARGCITPLILAKGRRVFAVRGDVITAQGEIKLRTHPGASTLEHLIAGLLGSEEPEQSLLDQISVGLGKQSFDALGLLWAHERVFTRVQFWELGADFLFVWGRVNPSFAVVNRLASLLFELASQLEKPNAEHIWNSICAFDRGAYLLPHEFRSRFAVDTEAGIIDAVILDAVKAGVLEPVYRLNADQNFLEEVERTGWTPELMSLRRKFEVGGVIVDGSDPKAISVAFRRLQIGSKVAP